MDKYKLPSENQYGFREKQCTVQVVTYFKIQLPEKLLPMKMHTLHLSQAFDTICHSSLLCTLQKYGIRGRTFQWIKSYLSDRNLSVSENRCTSGLSNAANY